MVVLFSWKKWHSLARLETIPCIVCMTVITTRRAFTTTFIDHEAWFAELFRISQGACQVTWIFCHVWIDLVMDYPITLPSKPPQLHHDCI